MSSEAVMSESSAHLRLSKATTVEEIRSVCRPKPLVGKELDAYFVETDESRDSLQDTRQLLFDALMAIEDARILFYGHRGCGKSTELNKFLSEHPDEFLAVKFSVLDEMSAVAARAEDLILVITDQVLQKAQQAGLSVNPRNLERVLKYFAETTVTTQGSRDLSTEAGAGLSTDASLWGTLLGLYAKFRAEIKYSAHSDETTIATLRKRPADLLAQANEVISAVRGALPDGKSLLIIVEDMDKLELKQAYNIYVNNATLMTGINAKVVYTIPVFLFHSPEAEVFIQQFDGSVALPMIKVCDFTQREHTRGFEIMRSIVLKRINEKLIENDALDMLIEKTGGVPRHTFEVLNHAAAIRDVTAPITKDHIRYGLDKLKNQLWLQVALPLEPMDNGPKSVSELYDRLTEYARRQRKGERVIPSADPINQLLLKSCALVEYNGKKWCGVHPLVIENLQELGRLE